MGDFTSARLLGGASAGAGAAAVAEGAAGAGPAVNAGGCWPAGNAGVKSDGNAGAPAAIGAGGGVFAIRILVPARLISIESIPLLSTASINPRRNSRSIMSRPVSVEPSAAPFSRREAGELVAARCLPFFGIPLSFYSDGDQPLALALPARRRWFTSPFNPKV